MSVEQDKLGGLLCAYLDGELSDQQARQLEAMLASDASAARRLEELRRAKTLVAALPPEAAPAGLAERVLAQIERQKILSGPLEESRPSRIAWAGWLAAAAAAVLVAGVAALVTYMAYRPSYLDRLAGKGPQVQVAQRDKQSPAATPTPMDADKSDGLALKEKAGPEPELELGAPLADSTVNLTISTDDLHGTQKDVERVFQRNDVLVEAELASRPDVATNAMGLNYSQQNIANRKLLPQEVRYEVVVDKRQLERIVGDLNDVRSKQNVAQVQRQLPGTLLAARAEPSKGGVAARRGVAAKSGEALQHKAADTTMGKAAAGAGTANIDGTAAAAARGPATAPAMSAQEPYDAWRDGVWPGSLDDLLLNLWDKAQTRNYCYSETDVDPQLMPQQVQPASRPAMQARAMQAQAASQQQRLPRPNDSQFALSNTQLANQRQADLYLPRFCSVEAGQATQAGQAAQAAQATAPGQPSQNAGGYRRLVVVVNSVAKE